MEEEVDDGQLFEVECFLNTRTKDGKRYYKVRWKGFSPEEDTWEPEENVEECTEALEGYWNKRKAANRQKKKRSYFMVEDETEPSTSAAPSSPISLDNITNLGLTRQATKELYKARTQIKQSETTSSQSTSGVIASENNSVNYGSESDTFDSSDVQSFQEPDIETIEVMSQSSSGEFEENYRSKNDGKVVISLLSDSESEYAKDESESSEFEFPATSRKRGKIQSFGSPQNDAPEMSHQNLADTGSANSEIGSPIFSQRHATNYKSLEISQESSMNPSFESTGILSPEFQQHRVTNEAFEFPELGFPDSSQNTFTGHTKESEGPDERSSEIPQNTGHTKDLGIAHDSSNSDVDNATEPELQSPVSYPKSKSNINKQGLETRKEDAVEPRASQRDQLEFPENYKKNDSAGVLSAQPGLQSPTFESQTFTPNTQLYSRENEKSAEDTDTSQRCESNTHVGHTPEKDPNISQDSVGFEIPTGRKKRFNLSLKKKNRRQRYEYIQGTSGNVERKENDLGNDKAEREHEIVHQLKLQNLREKMMELDKSKETPVDTNKEEEEEMSLVDMSCTGLAQHTDISNVSPSVTELKGIMYKLANEQEIKVSSNLSEKITSCVTPVMQSALSLKSTKSSESVNVTHSSQSPKYSNTSSSSAMVVTESSRNATVTQSSSLSKSTSPNPETFAQPLQPSRGQVNTESSSKEKMEWNSSETGKFNEEISASFQTVNPNQQLTESLKSKEEKKDGVTISLTTNYGIDEDVASTTEGGACDFVGKDQSQPTINDPLRESAQKDTIGSKDNTLEDTNSAIRQTVVDSEHLNATSKETSMGQIDSTYRQSGSSCGQIDMCIGESYSKPRQTDTGSRLSGDKIMNDSHVDCSSKSTQFETHSDRTDRASDDKHTEKDVDNNDDESSMKNDSSIIEIDNDMITKTSVIGKLQNEKNDNATDFQIDGQSKESQEHLSNSVLETTQCASQSTLNRSHFENQVCNQSAQNSFKEDQEKTASKKDFDIVNTRTVEAVDVFSDQSDLESNKEVVETRIVKDTDVDMDDVNQAKDAEEKSEPVATNEKPQQANKLPFTPVQSNRLLKNFKNLRNIAAKIKQHPSLSRSNSVVSNESSDEGKKERQSDKIVNEKGSNDEENYVNKNRFTSTAAETSSTNTSNSNEIIHRELTNDENSNSTCFVVVEAQENISTNIDNVNKSDIKKPDNLPEQETCHETINDEIEISEDLVEKLQCDKNIISEVCTDDGTKTSSISDLQNHDTTGESIENIGKDDMENKTKERQTLSQIIPDAKTTKTQEKQPEKETIVKTAGSIDSRPDDTTATINFLKENTTTDKEVLEVVNRQDTQINTKEINNAEDNEIQKKSESTFLQKEEKAISNVNKPDVNIANYKENRKISAPKNKITKTKLKARKEEEKEPKIDENKNDNRNEECISDGIIEDDYNTIENFETSDTGNAAKSSERNQQSSIKQTNFDQLNNNTTRTKAKKQKQLKRKRLKSPIIAAKKKKTANNNTIITNSVNIKNKQRKKKKNLQKTNRNIQTSETLDSPKQASNKNNSSNMPKVDGNTPSLASGDLIGLILDEVGLVIGDSNQIKPAKDKDNSDSCRDADEIDEDYEFEIELEDFPIENLLDEDVSELREIPSPPVTPVELTYADVKQAIRDGDEESVRAALAGGLELNLLDGASGMTLLMMASAACQDGIVELLLRKRADVNTEQKNGVTALMHACEQGCPETAHILLMCGADINKQQIAGETALMKACKKGHTDVVEVLLKHGADTKLETKASQTAANVVLPSPSEEIHILLEEHEKRLTKAVDQALTTCLGDSVSIGRPPILSYRCIAPREGQQFNFPFYYSPPKDTAAKNDVILFCIKANFTDDMMSLSFGDDNGVRGVLVNSKSQVPLLHGVRSIFSIEPKSGINKITIQTHKCTFITKLIVCIYAIQPS